ncbi:MAG TPA: hypothetical protein DCS93_36570 [Microscillaceae bacterium]|nr:hypothetical protein [Microscillaceae bacterium]
MQDIKQNIKLEITLEEANLLLEALGEMPFKKVFGLVGKIQNQAAPQVNGQNGQQAHQEVTNHKSEEVNV